MKEHALAEAAAAALILAVIAFVTTVFYGLMLSHRIDNGESDYERLSAAVCERLEQTPKDYNDCLETLR